MAGRAGGAAGGPIDIMGRVVGQKLGEAFGQSFIVDNRPGANGMIGMEQAFNSFGCTGQNISPALAWSNAPSDRDR